MPFQAHTNITLSCPEKVMAQVCAHLTEHDAEVEERAAGKVVRFQGSAAHISFGTNETRIEVSSPTLEGLYFMRMAIVSHIREFAVGEPPSIRWDGDGQNLARPPNFRIFEVSRLRDITPHMRRITLTGDDVGRFAPLEALHVNLIIPHPDGPADQWPRIGSDGLISWPDAAFRPSRRKYTVRDVDIESGTIDIDFVLHDDAGPGSGFASRASAGDRIGMIGPGGGGLVKADWYLFAGDETALPAIARMLENLPEGAKGKAIIEVADADEIQPLVTKASIDVSWICRNHTILGPSRALSPAVMDVKFPNDGSRIYVWAGCEYDDFRAIRTFLRKERGLKKEEHLVVSYWRRGTEEEGE